MNEPRIRIMGIETSCDETAVSIVENGRRVKTNLVASQITIHQRLAGWCLRWRLANILR